MFFFSILQRQLKYKVAISFDSKLYFTYCQLPPRVLCEPENNSDPNKTHDKAITGSPTNSPTEQAPSLARSVELIYFIDRITNLLF